MSGVAAAVGIGAAVVSTGVQMYGSSKSAKAQKNALQQQGNTSQSNYEVDQGLFRPYIDSGTNALGQLQTGLAKPMTDAQLAKAQQDYQSALNEWNTTEKDYNITKAQYNQLDANGKNAVGNSPEGFVKYFKPDLYNKYQAGKPVEPTNEGRGEFSQRANMTPDEFFASEAAAGRPVNEADQNWNTNFDTNAYLTSQGKSLTALNDNFDMNAWLTGQGKSTNALTRDFALTDYQEDPGYQFRLDQGNKGIEASAASRGGVLSGATMKALSEYNQGQASQEYQNSVNRFNTNRANLQGVAFNAQGQFITDRNNLVNNVGNEYNRFNTNQNKLYGKFVDAYGRQGNAKQQDFSNMYSLSNQGLSAANQLAQAGQNNANNQMGVQAGQGNVQAQQSNNNSNALAGLAGTVGSTVGKYYSNQPIDNNINALTSSSFNPTNVRGLN